MAEPAETMASSEMLATVTSASSVASPGASTIAVMDSIRACSARMAYFFWRRRCFSAGTPPGLVRMMTRAGSAMFVCRAASRFALLAAAA